MISGKRRILLLILILSLSVGLVSAATTYTLYQTSIEETRNRLVNSVDIWSRLVIAIYGHEIAYSDTVHLDTTHGSPLEATLDQIREANASFAGVGRTGEFTLAHREGDQIVFLMNHRHGDRNNLESVPFQSALAEPMRRALSGQTGTVKALDYRGETVLAAYRPVPALGWGIVAKIDLTEVRAPFIRTGAYAAAFAVSLIALGTFLFIRIGNPMIEQLQESEARFRTVFQQAAVGIAEIGLDGTWIRVNERLCGILGYSRSELKEKNYRDVVHPEDLAETVATSERMVNGDIASVSIEGRYVRKDGSTVWVNTAVSLVRNVLGKPKYSVAVITDIDDRKRAEEQVGENERFLATIFQHIPHMVFVKDADDLKFLRFNRAGEKLLGVREEDMLGKSDYDLFPADQAEAFAADDRQVLQTGRLHDIPEEFIQIRGNGERLLHTKKIPIVDDEGTSRFLLGISEDITEQKQAERALRESEERYRALVENINVGIALIDPGMHIMAMNKQMKAWFPDVEPNGRSVCYKVFNSPPRDEICTYCPTAKTLKDGLLHEATTETPTGDSIRYFRVVASPIKNEQGGVVAAIEMVEDLTERVNDELEKASLREQLYQSQRMESIGRLAGGVAHDFNNLLTVILNYADLLQTQVTVGHPMRSDVDEIYRAGLRAADLTKQLLAFSRKQIIAPQVIDLNEIMDESRKMLQRLIGEDIDLVFLLNDELEPIDVDPGQMNQILVNLAVNARDAMPEGGKLTVETSRVLLDHKYAKLHPGTRPGRYVMMAVSDNGCGMDRQTASQIFEPFFTTKGVEEGTGLGLSTVYGIAKQNGGSVEVYSEPDVGTTFKVYFPIAERESEAVAPAEVAEVLGRGETILVVEDEAAVRFVARRILERNGYIVLEAADAEEAIAKTRENADAIDMVLTDVVMPNMSGKECYEHLAEIVPGLKVLYMSGYTENAIAHHGVLDREVKFISKPFTVDSLARKVRSVLDDA